MVSILAFAYLNGIFDAEGIVRACHTNPLLRALCAEGAPFPQDLVKFRRRSRTLLLPVVSHLLHRVVEERFRTQLASNDAALARILQENAMSRLDIARHMDQGEGA
jgi:hypothetical protein